jgi:predicted transcriptional regulator
MIDLKIIEIKGRLTELQTKVLNLFRESDIIFLSKIPIILHLNYKQTLKIIRRLVEKGIIKRIERGKYRLTKIGKNYIKIIDLFNLSSKDSFNFSGYIDVDAFLNTTSGASIVSALLSDGSVSGNEIKFITVDEALNKYIWEKFERIFRRKVNEKYGSFRGRLETEFLRLFSPTYRTVPFRVNGKIISWPKPKIPDFIMNGDINKKFEFIKVYASCDGGVIIDLVWRKNTKLFYLQPSISIACKNPYLKQQLVALLKGLNFNPYQNDEHIVLTGDDIPKFSSIGFVNDNIVVHSSFWNGVKKNKLLGLALIIQKFGSDIIPFKLRQDKNKLKEIKEFLKSLLEKIEIEGLNSVESELFKIKNRNKLLKRFSSNWLRVLQALKNSQLSAQEVYKLIPNVKNPRQVLFLLKKKRLICNNFRKSWKITKFGRSILKDVMQM